MSPERPRLHRAVPPVTGGGDDDRAGQIGPVAPYFFFRIDRAGTDSFLLLPLLLRPMIQDWPNVRARRGRRLFILPPTPAKL